MVAHTTSIECRDSKFGKGLFATRDIAPGQIVAIFDGLEYTAESCLQLPSKDIADHAIQVGPNKWRDSKTARYMNHSCDPNCGFIDEIRLRTIRLIQSGEELQFDYDTCEDSNWSMECSCGSASCRGEISGFCSLMKKYPSIALHYQQIGVISPWLIQKYGLLHKE